jgi:hypothetical protein
MAPDPQHLKYDVNVHFTSMLMQKNTANKILSPSYHVSGEEAEGGALLEVVRLVLHDGVLVHFTKPSQDKGYKSYNKKHKVHTKVRTYNQL